MEKFYTHDDIKDFIIFKNPELKENHSNIIYEFLDIFYEFWVDIKKNEKININELINNISFNFKLKYPEENILWVNKFVLNVIDFISIKNGLTKQ